jgi:hypothetical protein
MNPTTTTVSTTPCATENGLCLSGLELSQLAYRLQQLFGHVVECYVGRCPCRLPATPVSTNTTVER